MQSSIGLYCVQKEIRLLFAAAPIDASALYEVAEMIAVHESLYLMIG